jgi:hypothetical protein
MDIQESMHAQSKVCYLMDGIKISALDAPTGQILGKPVLHSDFDGLVMLYKNFITQSKSSSSSALMCNVSAAGVTKGTIEDCYYAPAEYAMLSNEQKEQLHQLQGKQGHKPGAKDSKVLTGYVNKKAKDQWQAYDCRSVEGKCCHAEMTRFYGKEICSQQWQHSRYHFD